LLVLRHSHFSNIFTFFDYSLAISQNFNTLKLTVFIFRYSAVFFLIFLAAALWAFWTSYYGRLSDPMPYFIHFHGITMTAWCIMLISQSLLIRFKLRKVHKLLGRLSYFLVPLIIFSGFNIAHATLSPGFLRGPGSGFYTTAALMFNSIIIFAVIYGLAMWNRRNSPVHARYMLCTVFPLVTPVTDRLIYKYFPSFIEYAPMLHGRNYVPGLGFLLVDVILIGLIIWDWRTHKRLSVFPVVLGLLVLYHLSVMTFYDNGAFRVFINFVMGLPLS